MDAAGAAVGVASLGIQVCQGLLSYYDSWKDYKTDLSDTRKCIADLEKTFELIRGTLGSAQLDHDRAERAKECMQACEEGIQKLKKKLDKLNTHVNPTGLRQKTWTELQRVWYPFRSSTLAKLRETVESLQLHLFRAVQALQLEIDQTSLDLHRASHAQLALFERSTSRTADDVGSLITEQQANKLKSILDWLSPPDPWKNHNSARRRFEPETGAWLLQSGQYKEWKEGHIPMLWLHGKAGCGKTVISSTVIEDMRATHGNKSNIGFAFFYFSFSDVGKQSLDSLLSSLVSQLCRRTEIYDKLKRLHEKLYPSKLGTNDLQDLLLMCTGGFDEVFLIVDALDECPENEEGREAVLQCLQKTLQQATKVRMFVTSRRDTDIETALVSMRATSISVNTASVAVDIGRFIASRLSKDPKLRKLSESTKANIQETLQTGSDGMFRWAFCQLEELRKLPSLRPKYIEIALRSLPRTLDETYERMLTKIDAMCYTEALTALRWLSFAKRPLSLAEIADACVTDPAGEGHVDEDNRGGLEDILEILSGLVITSNDNEEREDDEDGDDEEDTDMDDNENAARQGTADPWLADTAMCYSDPRPKVRKDTKIRLAHFSVKEYLISDRIRTSKALEFALQESSEQNFLAQSCLAYMLHYSRSQAKAKARAKANVASDFDRFPLLEYSVNSWPDHHSIAKPGKIRHEISLFCAEDYFGDWLLLHQLDIDGGEPFETHAIEECPIYRASLLGLTDVVQTLLDRGADVNGYSGDRVYAIGAAAALGRKEVVEMLIKNGADIDAEGEGGTALKLAAGTGNKTIVELLIAAGADVTAPGECALAAAAVGGHETIVELLIAEGADVNGKGGHDGNPISAAARGGNKRIVERLIAEGADIHVQGGYSGNALTAAACGGNESIVEMLIAMGADIEAQGGSVGSALQVAADCGKETIVEMLLARGADANAQGGRDHSNALHDAACQAIDSWGCNEGKYKKIVEMLIAKGANTNARGGSFGNALQAAAWAGNETIVAVLLDNGADFNADGGHFGNALQAACSRGNKSIVQLLLDSGAEVKAQGGEYGTALQAACVRGNKGVVQLLLAWGAEVNAQAGRYGNALQAACSQGNLKVAEILIDRGADINAKGGEYGDALRAASRETSDYGGESMTVKKSKKDIVKMLIDKGAEVDAGEEDCLPPLSESPCAVDADAEHIDTKPSSSTTWT